MSALPIPFQVEIPRPVNYLTVRIGERPREERSFEGPKIHVGDLTPEQAEAVADLIRADFIEHARTCRERKKVEPIPRT